MDASDVPLRRAAGRGSDGESSLEVLGIGATEEHVYRVLLGRPGATLRELSDATALTPAQLRAVLRKLEIEGLASRSATRPLRFSPAPPDVALEVLILQRRHALQRVRLTVTALTELLRGSRHATPSGVEIVTGTEAITQRVIGLQRAAQTEVLVIDEPPYIAPVGLEGMQLELESIHRGVRWRGLYDTQSIQQPEMLEVSRRLAAAGEESRVLDAVPLKLIVADRRLAILPLELPVERETMLLHASPLLDGLVMLFEMLWERATPLWQRSRGPRRPAKEGEPRALDQRLLALLAAGLTDQVIARKLGVSQRTVERHISRIMSELGAKTRYQAGLQAARRGWFTPPETDSAARAPGQHVRPGGD